MSILNIREAKRAGARLVIGIDALSGDGKTYSALQVAWGLTGGDSKKIGFLDTENKRGSLYADKLVDSKGNVHPFLIADLDAPFTPERYAQAIKEFQAAGVEVLVIDSVTHEWEGSGGCTEIAEIDPSTGNARRMAAWNVAKSRHKKFMNALLSSDMHIITCIRSREKMRIEEQQGKKVYIPEGIQPIQEKNFVFELTVSFQLGANGKARFVKKCPEELIPIFGTPGEWADGYLTAKHGMALRDWVHGIDPAEREAEKARNILRSHAENGVKALQKAWSELPQNLRDRLGKVPDDIIASAKAFDEQKRTAVSDINEQIKGQENG